MLFRSAERALTRLLVLMVSDRLSTISRLISSSSYSSVDAMGPPQYRPPGRFGKRGPRPRDGAQRSAAPFADRSAQKPSDWDAPTPGAPIERLVRPEWKRHPSSGRPSMRISWRTVSLRALIGGLWWLTAACAPEEGGGAGSGGSFPGGGGAATGG